MRLSAAILNDSKISRSYDNQIMVTSYKCTNPDAARAIISSPVLKNHCQKASEKISQKGNTSKDMMLAEGINSQKNSRS